MPPKVIFLLLLVLEISKYTKADEKADDTTELRKEVWEKLTEELQDFNAKLSTTDKDGNFFTTDNKARGVDLLTLDVKELLQDVTYWLFTKKNKKKPQTIVFGDEDSLKNSNLNKAVPTKILIHGWLKSGNSPVCKRIKDAYLKKYDYNLIIVHWACFTGKADKYLGLVYKSKEIAKHFGEFIKFLCDYGINPKRIHIIGHDIGAHIAGFTQEEAEEKVGRITGLDPNSLGFDLGVLALLGGKGRLSSKHADFVDVVHTAIGDKIGFGIKKALGHADFYPNDGKNQPGCKSVPVDCSHARAWEYFAESINSPFLATKCTPNESNKTYVKMGDHTPSTARGVFFLETNGKPPFSRGSKIYYCKGHESKAVDLNMKLYSFIQLILISNVIVKSF